MNEPAPVRPVAIQAPPKRQQWTPIDHRARPIGAGPSVVGPASFEGRLVEGEHLRREVAVRVRPARFVDRRAVRTPRTWSIRHRRFARGRSRAVSSRGIGHRSARSRPGRSRRRPCNARRARRSHRLVRIERTVRLRPVTPRARGSIHRISRYRIGLFPTRVRNHGSEGYTTVIRSCG